MRVLALGGYGAVGEQLTRLLRERGHEVVVAGRDATRADRVVDVADLTTLRAALDGIDLLINTSGSEDVGVPLLASELGIPFIDISATTDYVQRVLTLDLAVPALVDVGLTPGLTNLLAVPVHEQCPGEAIDLVCFLGAGEEHGVAATHWTYDLLGRHFSVAGEQVRNYTKAKKFELPEGAKRTMFRLDFSDQHTLTDEWRVPVRTYFGLDSRLAILGLAALTWIPGSRKLPQGGALPGSDEWIVLARSASGVTRWAKGRNQSLATAVVAAAAADLIGRVPAGVHPLHQVMTIDELDSPDITVDVAAADA